MVALIPFIIWGIKSCWDSFTAILSIGLFSILASAMLIVGIVQPISLKSESIRQMKEREQIIYQIENLTEDSDKIKLNEWILTYNDWINDVNTSKKVYGWASWYNNFDMSNHTIINLV